MILDDASSTKKIDAVYLDLHGAMVVEHLDDGEGALLSLLRDKLGDDVPIVCSLDFHANVTPDMFELSDALTIFRSYPHIDMADTGRRAFLALKQMLEAEEKFVLPAASLLQISNTVVLQRSLMESLQKMLLKRQTIALQ